eukprot:gnl/TRDRNA2_/TRDRNA2_30505_c0_seq2.p1 gnl/TRDRNA2_/TRDRNA2_30505_c0~~gnl/TRDRNA2_/TRDRNA2_30505_c0_seq2.p1  ORF type:complete len:156 (-),score=27.34 gnl/TRDRNA2_/TRDRNA2_30505_c0_seq2:327-743(-)
MASSEPSLLTVSQAFFLPLFLALIFGARMLDVSPQEVVEHAAQYFRSLDQILFIRSLKETLTLSGEIPDTDQPIAMLLFRVNLVMRYVAISLFVFLMVVVFIIWFVKPFYCAIMSFFVREDKKPGQEASERTKTEGEK